MSRTTTNRPANTPNIDPEPTPTSAPWRRRTVLGLFVLPPLLVVVQLVSGEFIPPVTVFAVIFAGLGVALGRTEGRRLPYTAAVLGLVLIAANAPFMMPDLAHPETFASFAMAFVVLIVTLATVAAAVFATRPAPPNSARVLPAVGVILAIGLIASMIVTLGVTDDVRQNGDIDVIARNTSYPAELTTDAGPAALFIDNQDIIRHTLVIEGTDIKIEIPGSTTRRLEIDLPTGEYRYHCDVAGHDSMEGTLIVG